MGIHIDVLSDKMVPDNKVHGAYMGPTWGQQDPGGPHVGPMNLAIRGIIDNWPNTLVKFTGWGQIHFSKKYSISVKDKCKYIIISI